MVTIVIFRLGIPNFIVILVHDRHKKRYANDKKHNEILNGLKERDDGERHTKYKATELQGKDRKHYKENKRNPIHGPFSSLI